MTSPIARGVLRGAFATSWVALLFAQAALAAEAPAEGPLSAPLVCEGRLIQGGSTICRALPGSRVQIGEATTRADDDGLLIIGFDRDAPVVETAAIWGPDGSFSEQAFVIEARRYSISRIDGLPPSQVDTYSEAQLARIEASSARKQEGDASRAMLSGFRQGFAWPVAGRKTSPFGSQRILNGIEKRPHYGVDLAAPAGTPIQAPADGLVSLADDDLYFEGSMIVIDHGQGFLSKYLHVSRIDVTVGQEVRQGDVIGAVGSRGRSTGPHLCWRLKWRDRNLDPELWLVPRKGEAVPNP
jgi:murein DD-endopeptidase MepM/ murein hydrolase activator NlpD